ncbi:DUF1564 domain-containing protein [Leptospira sp. 201903070]|uniref:DUF1564 domain-containing protein n=1 Tax=Leptospira ainlahdjerensis TaxID=2810033 RepID=A0ABS2U8B0_9LEPT|nr:DUF1564 domain-containing protein [Leptospira ainlahdjerensis]MBM9575783.1 DUF1564 domain-containing protein [Leptospira ainlahdjerensis]
MGVLLIHSGNPIESTLQKNRLNVVTLLIPESTLLLYSEEERRNLPKRLPDLLRRYAKFLTASPRLGKNAGNTLYQNSSGLRIMRRMNVRMSTGAWALLGALSQAHGVSRCFLFNYMLWLDRAEVGDSIVRTMNEGGPTFHSNYSYILHLDLTKNKLSRTLKCNPEDYFYVLDYRDWFPS